MGLGDWIMATGEAKAHHARTGRRVCFSNGGKHYWSEVFDGNPKLARAPGEGIDILRQGGGMRPYISLKTRGAWTWKQYQPIPGEAYFTDRELEFGSRFRGRIIVEPNCKPIGHMNKDWGRPRWSELIKLLRDLPLAQLIAPGQMFLPGIEQIGTETFRSAWAVLKYARAAVLPEGGLHHAAAAVGLPAVVIYGGFISPQVTGYALHRNIYTGGSPLGCGMRTNCAHCKEAMATITPERIAKELRSLL